ncbi:MULTISPECIES: hypothetical protein [Streptomycetaceae]|uniref:hypothetical protein n=1 Tax=Streptomycetaceae TaxID=2062 RepID=UPI0009394EF2|nr:hypothetical protein [Streptomyces sp. CB02056]
MLTSPASAEATWDSYSIDRQTVRPGETFTITMTLTNTETTDIVFSYEYIEPNWPMNVTPGIVEAVGCGGDVTDCSVSGKTAVFHPRVPIAPGDSRSVTFTARALPPPVPGSGPMRLSWSPYMYYEYDYTPGGPLHSRIHQAWVPQLTVETDYS